MTAFFVAVLEVFTYAVNKFKSHLDKFKILCVIIKLKFTKPRAKVTDRTCYIRLPYFISFVFVMWAQRHWPALVSLLRLRQESVIGLGFRL